MNDNTTATGGYLTPQNDPYGKDLTHPVHDVIAGCTGLADDMIRPRWQQEPPTRPAIDANWCAFGVQNIEQDSWSQVDVDESIRHERITFLMSFYGPDAMGQSAMFSTSAQIPPNVDISERAGLFYGSAGDITPAPDMLNERWYNRYDIAIEYRRQVRILYNILSIESASVEISSGEPAQSRLVYITNQLVPLPGFPGWTLFLPRHTKGTYYSE